MITVEQIKSQQSHIVEGLEFYIPNHQATDLIKVIVTKRTMLDKTSCWGSYQQDAVFFQEIAQALKRSFVNKQRADGSQYTDIVWVPDEGKFNTQSKFMSIGSFIEFVFNKKIDQNNEECV